MYTMRDQVFDAIEKYGYTEEAAAHAAENYFLAHAQQFDLPSRESDCRSEQQRLEMVKFETDCLYDALERVNIIVQQRYLRFGLSH
jgi:hypothetical protein